MVLGLRFFFSLLSFYYKIVWIYVLLPTYGTFGGVFNLGFFLTGQVYSKAWFIMAVYFCVIPYVIRFVNL